MPYFYAMARTSFLDDVAQLILTDYPDPSALTVVLPNKRARVFLTEALRRNTTRTMMAPQIVSIEDLIGGISALRAVDNIELLFEFYTVYLDIVPKEQAQTFELFSNWAVTLLQDFNEIDRYLLEPGHVFSYLKDIDDIKRWGIGAEEKTPLIEKYVGFWQMLPVYYKELQQRLLSQGRGYQGLLYREAVRNLEHFTETLPDSGLLFAGFNALNAAEERIFQHLLALGKARVLWDADAAFLDDPLHDAGLFLRKYRQNWGYYKSHPFEWLRRDFAQPKTIRIIGTPKSVGQAYIAGKVLETCLEEDPDLQPEKTALVLADENLLLPVLHGLPDAFRSLNITMGYPAKGNPVQVLVSRLFRLHVNAAAKSGYVFYHRDLMEVLTHPLLQPLGDFHAIAATLKRNNFTYISPKRLSEFSQKGDLTGMLFSKWDEGPVKALDILSELLLRIKRNLAADSPDAVTGAFVYTVYQTLNKLRSYCLSHPYADSLETVFSIYKQIIALAEVSFEGEPLGGLQVMGVLESRVLDFDTVVITSVNEGRFPAGKSSNSFIPHDVKRELGLPTYKEKDAIYTYHFYHLLQRATKILLLYNTESEGLDAGEKSRFITQLEIDRQAAHTLTHEIWNAEVPDLPGRPFVIAKSDAVLQRLETICREGFSPSALTSYVRNPVEFYFRKVLRIREADEVEENIAVNTLGSIIHGTLEALFRPLIGKQLTTQDLADCETRLDDEVTRQFRAIYKEGDIKTGKNLLAFQVAKRNVLNYLKLERRLIEEEGSQVVILALEETFERQLDHPDLPYPVLLKGNVDRIEWRDGRIRIVDFKTGKAEQRNLTLSGWEELTTEIKTDKIIQVLAYAYMYAPLAGDRPMEAGVISFKNMKSGFLGFRMKGSQRPAGIDAEVLASYAEGLVGLLKEILDPTVPFYEQEA